MRTEPLEWNTSDPDYWYATCPHTYLNYAVMRAASGLVQWRGAFDWNDALSMEAGRQSAVADYATRITSAAEGIKTVLFGHWSKHRLSDGVLLPLGCYVPEGPDYTTIPLYAGIDANKAASLD